MRKILVRSVAAAALLFGTTACYHATVDTGRTPNGVEVEKNWAASWLGGLVPPSTVEVAQQCPNGVARVETQLSFLNQLAAWLTAYIYTPMTITVQCAGPTAMVGAEVIEVASAAEMRDAMTKAAAMSTESGDAVYVNFSGAE